MLCFVGLDLLIPNIAEVRQSANWLELAYTVSQPPPDNDKTPFLMALLARKQE